MAKFKIAYRTPIAELRWVNLEGKSFNPDNSDPKKVATAVFTDPAQVKQLIEYFNNLWVNVKKQLNLKATIVNTTELPKAIVDENGNPTGEYELRFKTSASFNGKETIIPIYNAQGKEVDLGDRCIGNGSKGVIYGDIGYYYIGGKHGLSLYLKAIQITEFVEYRVGVETQDLTSSVAPERAFVSFDETVVPL